MVMFPGPFLKREMVTSVRCARVIRDRLIALLLVTGGVAGCVVVWDEWGWDRTSVREAAWFALVAFGLTAFAQAGIAIGLVVGQVAPAIASERDRKSLDALLTTQLSSAKIVVGTMAAGLLRAANGLAAALPLVVLMVFLGGVDPGLVLLSGAGLASTALAAAAISVVASVGARTRGRAVSIAVGLVLAWLALPSAFLALRMLLWTGGPRWLTQAALWLLDSSPFGVGLSLLGVMPRPGSIIERVLRMMALETAGAAVLTLWAAWRLRPASRALEDVEGQSARLRMLRQWRRRRPRPPCGDDPVLWNAIQTNRRATVGAWIEDRLIGLVWIGLIALVTSWFAVPAFRELAARGYGAAPEAFTMPAWNPLVRVLVDKLIMPGRRPGSGAGPPGVQHRLETVLGVLGLGLRPRTLRGRRRGREGGAGARHLARSDRNPALRVGDPPGQDARARPESPSRRLDTDRALDGRAHGRRRAPPGLPGSGHGAGGACLVLFGTGRFHVAAGGRHEKGRPPAGPCRPPRGRARGDLVAGGDLGRPRLVVAALVRGCFLRGPLGRVPAVRHDGPPDGGGSSR